MLTVLRRYTKIKQRHDSDDIYTNIELSHDKQILINDTILLADMLTDWSCPKTGITLRHNTVGRYAYGFATIYQNKTTTRLRWYIPISINNTKLLAGCVKYETKKTGSTSVLFIKKITYNLFREYLKWILTRRNSLTILSTELYAKRTIK